MKGRRLGSYELTRRLGEGGMGVVWEARHVELGRRVAIKLLHPALAAQPEVERRFSTEARVVHLVRHPGVVDVLELGRLDDGTAYIVMELLAGESLAARLQRLGALPMADVLRVARQVASPLAAAHASGVVHRDLKPENLMIVADPEVAGGERIKVLDFGIAKLLGDDDVARSATRTRTGLILGTPRYMAPEQCRGGRSIDAAVDVYALGVIVFEMVAGGPPFAAAGSGEVMMQHIADPPPPLATVRPGTPPRLVALVEAMLAKEPAERPLMSQVVVELERLGAPQALAHATVALLETQPRLASPPRAARATTTALSHGERVASGERANVAAPARATRAAWWAALPMVGIFVAAGWWRAQVSPRAAAGARAEAPAPTPSMLAPAPADLGPPPDLAPPHAAMPAAPRRRKRPIARPEPTNLEEDDVYPTVH